MNIARILASKKLLAFNLVFIGIIFGVLMGVTCVAGPGRTAAQAQVSPVTIPSDALAVAESIQTVFQSVAEKALPSIVELQTITVTRQTTPSYNGIPWEFFFGPQGGDSGESEREYQSEGLGSGIIVRQDKDTYYVLTNEHVVRDTTEVTVVTHNGKEYEAEVVGADERRDLAIVSFKTTDPYQLATLGDSDNVKVGDWAIAIGNPLGYMSSVTMGIVSAIGRTGGPSNNINDFIQTDASINQGNSGGALLNIRGEVIGINDWIATTSSSGSSVGLGFAIPVNNAKRVIDELITNGQITDGWLGISMLEADKDTAKALNIEGKRGVLAAMVFLGSPADKAGIRPGDFITHINGREVASSTTTLSLAVGDLKAGEKAIFTFIRDGASMDLTVTIEARDNTVAADNSKLWPGLYPIPLTDAVITELKLSKNTKGVYVVQVQDKSPASIVGLQRGDIITSVNGVATPDLASFYKVLRENATRELWFGVKRGENTLETMRYQR
jgi:Do/DeqQ family serine protease